MISQNRTLHTSFPLPAAHRAGRLAQRRSFLRLHEVVCRRQATMPKVSCTHAAPMRLAMLSAGVCAKFANFPVHHPMSCVVVAMQPVVIDCRGHMLGRLASVLAKQLLRGEYVVSVLSGAAVTTPGAARCCTPALPCTGGQRGVKRLYVL